VNIREGGDVCEGLPTVVVRRSVLQKNSVSSNSNNNKKHERAVVSAPLFAISLLFLAFSFSMLFDDELVGPPFQQYYHRRRQQEEDQKEGIVKSMLARPFGIRTNYNNTNQNQTEHNSGFDRDDLPFIVTVRERVVERSSKDPSGIGRKNATKRLYDIFVEEGILPTPKCLQCMGMTKCLQYSTNYSLHCLDYENTLCPKYEKEAENIKMPVAKELVLSLPPHRRDPNRLVPRIVHQTWFEPITPDRYPNMNRLAESFRAQDGWQYRFYTDQDVEAFLELHFPTEVLEAYQTIIPGALKADLFRYCALLVYGGVYADVDVLLEADLDAAVEPDVGFMVPMDAVRCSIYF